MNIQDAKLSSRRLVLLGTATGLAIILFIYMLFETRGDFANGIIFFLSDLLNLYSIIGLITVFAISGIAAGTAAADLFIKNQNPLMISLKYSAIISFLAAIYTAVTTYILTRGQDNITTITSIITTTLIPNFIKTMPFFFFVWVWAMNKMKSKKEKTG